MELLKSIKKRRTVLSEIIYYGLNIGLVVVLFVMALTLKSPLMALVLVVLSKWRVFAVRPRHWWSNIQANMVDLIVGVSIVALMYVPTISVVSQIVLAAVYGVWLIGIKPLSKRWQMQLQAGVAIFFGTTALFSSSYEWPAFVTVLGMFIIGYSAARHFLYSYDEERIVELSLVWGILFAELGWLAHFWAMGYGLPGLEPLKLPQITIIVLLLSFLGEKAYRGWHQDKKLTVDEMVAPILLVVGLVVAVLVFFNSVTV